MLRTHLHLDITLIRMTSGQSLGTFRRNGLSDISQSMAYKRYFHISLVFQQVRSSNHSCYAIRVKDRMSPHLCNGQRMSRYPQKAIFTCDLHPFSLHTASDNRPALQPYHDAANTLAAIQQREMFVLAVVCLLPVGSLQLHEYPMTNTFMETEDSAGNPHDS